MRLNTRRSNGVEYVYFLESYRDPVTKEPRTRTVKSFGRRDVLEARDPDIMSKLQAECDRINAEEDSYRFKVLEHTQVVVCPDEDGGRNKIYLTDSLIISYSSKRAEKDAKDRGRLIKKAEKLVGNPSMFKAELKKGGKSFVAAAIDGNSLKLDAAKIAEQSLYDGYYGILSSDPEISPEEAVSIHHGLWKIEESFRIMKSGLRSRPCFVWTPEHIKGHFVICYLALVLQRLLEKKLKERGIAGSSQAIQDSLNKANVMELRIKGQIFYAKEKTPKLYDEIADTLGIAPLRTYSTKTDLQKHFRHRIS
ncbi:hypothetical protein [Cloacibacillus evryensis]|uniref:IS1634 family transposase n=1 Tax=Cloacibacillus evryensis TaxID=508460 RepID=UPI00370DCBD2